MEIIEYHDPTKLLMETSIVRPSFSALKLHLPFGNPGALCLSCLVLFTSLGCSGSASDAPPSTSTTSALDGDGVQMLFPSAPGSSFHLGTRDPNATANFVIEQGTPATPATSVTEGALQFWNLPSYPLAYSSGGTGWTSRLHMHASGGTQQFTWKTHQGYLSNPADVKNLEFTVFIRVHQILDAPRAAVTLKFRGGRHTSSNPDLASCVMLTFSPGTNGSATRFGKELTHPNYDYVNLTPAFTASLAENTWFGLKAVSWNDPHDATRVVNRLYLDTDPFDAQTGKPKNGWRLFSEYVDIEGKSTGQYTKLVNWGGWETTVRTDGFHDIDFALPSVREITP